MTFAARTFMAHAASNIIYNGTITCGSYSTFGVTYRGYYSGFLAGSSASPTTILSGETVFAVYDYRFPSATPDPDYFAAISISNFVSDPGISFFSSAIVNGVTKTTSTANYSWDNATKIATWSWDGITTSVLFGMPTSGTVSAQFFG